MSKCLTATLFYYINFKRGTCDKLANFALFLILVNGIPSAIDRLPTCMNQPESSICNTLLIPNGKIKGEICFK